MHYTWDSEARVCHDACMILDPSIQDSVDRTRSGLPMPHTRTHIDVASLHLSVREPSSYVCPRCLTHPRVSVSRPALSLAASISSSTQPHITRSIQSLVTLPRALKSGHMPLPNLSPLPLLRCSHQRTLQELACLLCSIGSPSR